jgi:ribosomal protein L37AE/L43A
MPAQSGVQRQTEQTSGSVKEETLEAMLKDFSCEACGHYNVRRTERESWYTCVDCGYSFGIEPYPKRLRRGMDAGGTDSISH